MTEKNMLEELQNEQGNLLQEYKKALLIYYLTPIANNWDILAEAKEAYEESLKKYRETLKMCNRACLQK